MLLTEYDSNWMKNAKYANDQTISWSHNVHQKVLLSKTTASNKGLLEYELLFVIDQWNQRYSNNYN